jgi:hypothetical protein
MMDEWIIDGVLRPRGSTGHLSGGFFDLPCGGHKPDKAGEPAKPDLKIVDATDETAGLKVFVKVNNEGACPFSVHLLNTAGKDVVSVMVAPKNDSGWIRRSGIAIVELRCAGSADAGRCKGSYDVWIG